MFKALGNLANQCFHQRTLSASSVTTAKITCFAAAVIFPLFGIPSILIGAAAASTGKNDTEVGLKINTRMLVVTGKKIRPCFSARTYGPCHLEVVHYRSHSKVIWSYREDEL